MTFLYFYLLAVFTLSVSAIPYLSFKPIYEDHDEQRIARRLPTEKWFHSRGHPAHQLFQRDTDSSLDEVGSSSWSAAYPSSTPDSSNLPASWTNALNAAVLAGKIPDIPQSTLASNGIPTYPKGYEPTSSNICSGTYKCQILTDFWDAPDGFIGTGFDDGPTEASSGLLDFLDANDEVVTHFMIGVNILNEPASFSRAVNLGHDIAVHTWTHPYMTTLSNEEVLGQLAWTMQIIHDSTGGRIPKFWRPPYGDTDARVSAIAREVLGMNAIIWNQDTEDWSLTTNGTTLQAINASMTTWLTGSKSPGLIILEHELSNLSVEAFKTAYSAMKSNGWNLKSVTQLVASDESPYRNADSINSGSVSSANIVVEDLQSPSASSSTTATGFTTTSQIFSSSATSTVFSSQTTSGIQYTGSSPSRSTTNSASSTWTIGTSFILGAILSAFIVFL